MFQQTPTVQSSVAEVWYLKKIRFGQRELKIITQNFNGPCSFIAICNILILRGKIEILPPERTTASYEFLSQLVAEYLLLSSPDVDISAALSIMPVTQKGMDLNPDFTSATTFRPDEVGGGGLKLFEQVGISLVHGWLVDPQSPEAKTVERIPDYDTAAYLIAEVDHLTNGRFVLSRDELAGPGGSGSGSGSATPASNHSKKEREKIEDAIVIRRFIESTFSQLTYHGLFNLAITLEPGSLVALFRSSHLSVLYKTQGEHSALYTLVTDQSFLNEPSVVWEHLEDVDGGSSTFVDSDFMRSSPAGGDFAGQTAEDALRAAEIEAGVYQGISDPIDQELARQMQAEEDNYARERREQYMREKRRKRERELERQKKKKGDCIIM